MNRSHAESAALALKTVREGIAAIEAALTGSRWGASAVDPLPAARQFLHEAKGRREALIGLVSDPAWEMLLVLFIARAERRDLPISHVAKEAGVAFTSAYRWLDKLEGAGLIERRAPASDRRVVLVHLTDEGCRQLERLLE